MLSRSSLSACRSTLTRRSPRHLQQVARASTASAPDAPKQDPPKPAPRKRAIPLAADFMDLLAPKAAPASSEAPKRGKGGPSLGTIDFTSLGDDEFDGMLSGSLAHRLQEHRQTPSLKDVVATANKDGPAVPIVERPWRTNTGRSRGEEQRSQRRAEPRTTAGVKGRRNDAPRESTQSAQPRTEPQEQKQNLHRETQRRPVDLRSKQTDERTVQRTGQTNEGPVRRTGQTNEGPVQRTGQTNEGPVQRTGRAVQQTGQTIERTAQRNGQMNEITGQRTGQRNERTEQVRPGANGRERVQSWASRSESRAGNDTARPPRPQERNVQARGRQPHSGERPATGRNNRSDRDRGRRRRTDRGSAGQDMEEGFDYEAEKARAREFILSCPDPQVLRTDELKALFTSYSPVPLPALPAVGHKLTPPQVSRAVRNALEVGGNYTRFLSKKALRATRVPPTRAGALALAHLTLARRPDVTLPRRQHALSIVDRLTNGVETATVQPAA